MRKKNFKKKSESILLLLIILLTFASVLTIDLNNTQKNNERLEQSGLKSSNGGWAPNFKLTVGREPTDVFIGDANNDGYNDIVTSNCRSNDISILLWNFTLMEWNVQIRKPVGTYPFFVYIGDANNDGFNDLVCSNRVSGDVSIILWNSTIMDWNTQIRKHVGSGQGNVFIGDANNDGYNDIAIAKIGGVSIFLWNFTRGEWDEKLDIDIVYYTYAVSLEDANNDGYIDIIAADLAGEVNILLWNWIIKYWDEEIKISVGDMPLSVFVKDVNNDGYYDIVTSNMDSNDISILLWNYTLMEWNAEIRKSVGSTPYSVFSEDANNDGFNDLVCSNTGSDDVSIILWNSTVMDWNTQIRKHVGHQPAGVFIGDANNDDYNDIVTAINYAAENAVSVYLWNTPPSIAIIKPKTHEVFGAAPDFDIAVKDYDLDSMWYSLDNGLTNISFSQFNGSIDQLEWDNLEDGTVIIRFYANDTAGQIGSAYVVVGKNIWSPPNPPENVDYYSGFHSITLVWDPPVESAPVSQYNVYRGEIPGGGKIYVGTSDVTNFTDNFVDFNKDYYYVIKAENIAGESNASDEINAIAGPYIRWQAPNENERVILPVDALFNFVYDYMYLHDVRLFLNGIDYGSVKDKDAKTISPYNSSIDGLVEAVLYGYEMGNSNPILNDSRDFILAKLDAEAYEILEMDETYLGEKLYLILHDPNGDNSYTWYEESSVVSMAVGLEITSEYSTGNKYGEILSDPFVGSTAGATFNFVDKETTEEGFNYRYEIVDTTQLQSSLDDSNKDFIGSGYGDRYWGEAWTLKWAVKAYYRKYFNGTEGYEAPEFHYGIIRGQEVFLSDYSAPQEWRIQNPVHNGWQGVSWLVPNQTIAGGSPVTNSYEISSTETTSTSLQIAHSEEMLGKVPGWESTTTLNVNTKWYTEAEVTTSYEVGYTIYDDESTDTIVQDVGIDLRFGTFIFRTNEFMCETSYPLEHNTFDYLPPIIEFPRTELDSSQDGLAPCKDDSPIVTVELFDEGGIQSAYIRFSINNGANWNDAILSEQIANLGTWQGTIPAYDHGTTVLWYIKVWDFEGSFSNRTDPHGNPYQYTVINRAPTILITTPNGNEGFEDTVRIEWSALDPDGDDLTFTISYNLANTGWRLIETSVTGNFYDWDISDIEFYDTVLVKVTVDDEFGGTAADESDYVFTIGKPEPVEVIPSEINWTLPLTIASLSFVGAAFTIAIFIRRSRRVKE